MSAVPFRDDLWRRFFDGDVDAFSDIVRHCHSDLLQRVRRRLAGPLHSHAWRYRGVDPSDVCQRIYMRLWQRRANRRVRNIEAYLEVIVRNAVRSEMRVQVAGCRDIRRRHSAPIQLLENELARDPPTSAMETRDELLNLLTKLPGADRRMLGMVSQGMSWSEIGERMSLHANSARMRFQRVTQRLRVMHE